jgi:glycosyltransferase involved in cell wall biosynthesis
MLLGGFVRTAVALRGSFKVIHAQWVLAVIPGVLLATLLRIPYLVTLRGEDIRLLRRRLFGSLLVPLLRRAAAVVTVSESFASELRERHRLTGERVHFIPNGVEVSPPREDVVQALRDSFLPVEGMALLLFVGTVIPRKDVVTVVRALAEPGMERSVLVVCGRLDDERYVLEVEELAARLGVDNRLHLRGAVGTGQVPHYLAAARYYVTASTFEGRSNSLLEALSAGVPVIASDIPAHREVVSHGENGLLFTPKDPVALAHHIRILESSPERRALLSNGAKQSALQFTWERCAAEHVRLYASVGNRGA